MILEEVRTTITAGREYVFVCRCSGECTVGYHGHRYRLVRFVQCVPVYTDMALVECLSGPDEGLWFVCSLANFATRYEMIKEVNVCSDAQIVEAEQWIQTAQREG